MKTEVGEEEEIKDQAQDDDNDLVTTEEKGQYSLVVHNCPIQGLSQDSETRCQKLPIVKSLGLQNSFHLKIL